MATGCATHRHTRVESRGAAESVAYHSTSSNVARTTRKAPATAAPFHWRVDAVFALREADSWSPFPLPYSGRSSGNSPSPLVFRAQTGEDESPPENSACGAGAPCGGYTSPSDPEYGSGCVPDLRDRPCGFSYMKDVTARLLVDQRNFYDVDTLAPLAIGLGVGAVFANTQLDREIGEQVQDNLRNNATDSVASAFKLFGDGHIMGPIYAVAFASFLIPHEWEAVEPLELWGERSFRAALAGAIPMLLLQKITGADRPDMSEHGSRWIPWTENHGVSGHSFMGAIPFLTAAKLTENRAAKFAFVTASLLPAWSRVNDNDHYFSQAALGWFMGYLAVEAVNDTEMEAGGWRVVPIPASHGEGIGIETRW